MTKSEILLPIIVFAISISILGTIVAFGAVTLDNSNRREYGYCPLAPEGISSRVSLQVNGCPLMRVYISNWNQLTTLEQTTVDTQLRSMGFKDIGEFDVRVRN